MPFSYFANLQLMFYNMQYNKVENIDDLQERATLFTFNIIQFTDFTAKNTEKENP